MKYGAQDNSNSITPIFRVGNRSKDPGEHHVRDRSPRPVVLARPKRCDAALRDVVGERTEHAGSWPVRARVHAQRHAERLGGRPQRIAAGQIVGPALAWIGGDAAGHQPQLGATLQLGHGLVDVVDVQQRGALDRVGIGGGEILRHPVVDRSAASRHQVGVDRSLDQAHRDGREHHLPDHTVTRQGRHPRLGIVGGPGGLFVRIVEAEGFLVFEAPPGLGGRPDRADRDVAVRNPAIDPVIVNDARGAVAVPGIDPGDEQVRWLDHVRIGRDELLDGGHARSSSHLIRSADAE